MSTTRPIAARRIAAAAIDLSLPLAVAVAVGIGLIAVLRAAMRPSGLVGIAVAGAVLVLFALTWAAGSVVVDLVQPLRRAATPGERWLGFVQERSGGSRWGLAGRLVARGVIRATAMWGVATLWFVGVVERSAGVRWLETGLAVVATVAVLACVGWPLHDGATAPLDRLAGVALRDVRGVTPGEAVR